MPKLFLKFIVNGIFVPAVPPVTRTPEATRVGPHHWREAVFPAMVTVTHVNISLPVNEIYTVSHDRAPVHALDRMTTEVSVGLRSNSVK